MGANGLDTPPMIIQVLIAEYIEDTHKYHSLDPFPPDTLGKDN